MAGFGGVLLIKLAFFTSDSKSEIRSLQLFKIHTYLVFRFDKFVLKQLQ